MGLFQKQNLQMNEKEHVMFRIFKRKSISLDIFSLLIFLFGMSMMRLYAQTDQPLPVLQPPLPLVTIDSPNSTVSVPTWKFDFGSGNVEKGYVKVLPDLRYSEKTGYGFITDSALVSVDRRGGNALLQDYITGNNGFYFSVDVPEGNYDVTVILGDQEGETETNIKAESRRLMIDKVRTAPGEFKTVMFTTNVRYSSINDSENVSLKPREIGHLDWDKQLTIEMNGRHPGVCALEISKTEEEIGRAHV